MRLLAVIAAWLATILVFLAWCMFLGAGTSGFGQSDAVEGFLAGLLFLLTVSMLGAGAGAVYLSIRWWKLRAVNPYVHIAVTKTHDGRVALYVNGEYAAVGESIDCHVKT